MVAAMASVAPTVTSTWVLGVELDAVPGPLMGRHGVPQLGDAAAGRVLVAPLADGGDRHLAQLLGPVGVRKTLTEIDRVVPSANSDMVAKMVVVKACSRRVSCASRGATATMVPTAFWLAYRRATVLSIANYNMHCGMDGWGRPYDYVAAIAALDADVIVLEEAWTVAGDERAVVRRPRRPGILGYQVEAHTLGEGRRIRPQPEAPPQVAGTPSLRRTRQGALYGRRAARVGPGRESGALAGGRAGLVGYRRAGATRAGHRVGRVLPMARLRADRVRRAAWSWT